MQALPAGAESLCIVEMGGGGEMGSSGGLFLNIGLQNGVLLRTALDSVTGDLSDTRTRSLDHCYSCTYVLLVHHTYVSMQTCIIKGISTLL